MNGRGIVFGYFFGPKILQLADVRIASDLTPERAVLTCQFGDLGLLNQQWPVVGKIPRWSCEQWPMPTFLYADPNGNTGFIREYDKDSLKCVREQKVLLSQISKGEFPKDGLKGYGAVEITLTKL